jgi:hypothetical protein
MDEIAPEYDVIVLGTGMSLSHPASRGSLDQRAYDILLGLTECVLSGYEQTVNISVTS